MLSQFAVFYNDPGLINTRYERLSSITAADVQRVAKQYLTPENRTVVITNPKPATPSASAGGQKGGLRCTRRMLTIDRDRRACLLRRPLRAGRRAAAGAARRRPPRAS